MERWEIEDIILGMADIVLENRWLRKELKEAKEFEIKYNEAIAASAKQAAESQRAILEAIFAGAFNSKTEE